MTYTTEERIEIERRRYESKASVLRDTEDARTEYVTATKDAQTQRDVKIKAIRTDAKVKLAESIKEYLDSVRSDDKTDENSGDDNE